MGIDLVPHKICSQNCVYCECGATTLLTMERQSYVPCAEVLTEIDRALAPHPQLDAVTFSGSGEPTLSRDLLQIATHIRQHYPDYPLVLLTNGTLLGQPDVREAANQMSIVKVSVDAATEEVFSLVNRGCANFTVEDLFAGIATFAIEFKGRLHFEVFIVPGINDGDSEMEALAARLKSIPAETIQLNGLDRPATEPWVTTPSLESLARIERIFAKAGLPNTERIGKCLTAASSINQEPPADRSLVMAAILRRPMTKEDLATTTGLSAVSLESLTSELIKEGAIQTESGPRGCFFRVVQPH